MVRILQEKSKYAFSNKCNKGGNLLGKLWFVFELKRMLQKDYGKTLSHHRDVTHVSRELLESKQLRRKVTFCIAKLMLRCEKGSRYPLTQILLNIIAK